MGGLEARACIEHGRSVVVCHDCEVHASSALAVSFPGQCSEDGFGHPSTAVIGVGGHALDPGPALLDHDLADTDRLRSDARVRYASQMKLP